MIRESIILKELNSLVLHRRSQASKTGVAPKACPALRPTLQVDVDNNASIATPPSTPTTAPLTPPAGPSKAADPVPVVQNSGPSCVDVPPLLRRL